MPPARRITPSTRSAGASRVSNSEAATHLQVSPSVLSTCAHDLKVPLPPKTPLSPAFPGSTTVLMARSPCPLPSAACPRTPPSHPPLELLPTCSAVTQVARTAVHGGEHPPLFQGMFPLFAPPPSGVNLPSTAATGAVWAWMCSMHTSVRDMHSSLSPLLSIP